MIVESRLHFGDVSHPSTSPIVKHKAKFIMNQSYVDHKAYEWECSLCLFINSGRVLTPINSHLWVGYLDDSVNNKKNLSTEIRFTFTNGFLLTFHC